MFADLFNTSLTEDSWILISPSTFSLLTCFVEVQRKMQPHIDRQMEKGGVF